MIVDTCVFSLALRRRQRDLHPGEKKLRSKLTQLVAEGLATLLGPVRQELLSGICDASQFQELRQRLRALPHPALEAADYEQAAEASNACRAAGLAGGSVDFLICGVSLHRDWPIFTTDQDFERYRRILTLRLFS
ncbi:MAG: PIN domain-containing protein [Terriglobales bacterium]